MEKYQAWFQKPIGGGLMNDEMRPDDRQRSRLLRLRSVDAEFAAL